MEWRLSPNRKVKVNLFDGTVMIKFTDFFEGRHFALTADQWWVLGQVAPHIGHEVERLLREQRQNNWTMLSPPLSPAAAAAAPGAVQVAALAPAAAALAPAAPAPQQEVPPSAIAGDHQDNPIVVTESDEELLDETQKLEEVN